MHKPNHINLFESTQCHWRSQFCPVIIGPALLPLSPPLGSCLGGGSAGRTAAAAGRTAAAAGPAGYIKNALLRRRLRCMLPTVPDLAGEKKKTGMGRSGPTPSAFRRACRPGGSGTGGAPTRLPLRVAGVICAAVAGGGAARILCASSLSARSAKACVSGRRGGAGEGG